MGKKKMKTARKSKKATTTTLEQIYQQYLIPMTVDQWTVATDLSQPSTLKQIPTKTAYCSVE